MDKRNLCWTKNCWWKSSELRMDLILGQVLSFLWLPCLKKNNGEPTLVNSW